MIITNVTRRFPNCVKIMSHPGGTLPFLVSRIVVKSRETKNTQITYGKTYADIMDDLRSFHYDVTLSSSHAVMNLLLELIPRDRITYGNFKEYNKTGKCLWVLLKLSICCLGQNSRILGKAGRLLNKQEVARNDIL